MSKRKDMMDQIQQLQAQLQQAQADLAEESVEASAGGGAVKVKMSGTQECLGIQIAADLVEDADLTMLQDLVMLAVNQAIRDSQLLAARRLGPLSSGMNIPGIER
jgi:hypothetical protein